ncbi:MAG: hypothetical protein WDO24_10995 [Pseudomonadota bacterium]
MFDNLSIFENLELALKAPRDVFAALRFKLDGAQRARIEEILELIGLTERGVRAVRHPVARPASMARDRHAADAGSRAPADRRAGRRHDGSGDPSRPPSCCVGSPASVR